MTYRLVVLHSDGVRQATEYDTFLEVLQVMLGQVPWHDEPIAVTIRRLGPWESVTWSVVVAGDEVLAPNNTTWMVNDVQRVNGIVHYEIANTLDGATTITKPQPDAVVRRRRGLIAAVRQMLDDAGMPTTLLR